MRHNAHQSHAPRPSQPTAIEQLPLAETTLRHARYRALLAQHTPNASGLLLFSRVSIYHACGSLANGVLWLPVHGEPVLLVRKGIERVSLESPLANIVPFKSYADIAPLCAAAGSPLGDVVAAEMNGLSWSLSSLLISKMPHTRFVPGDATVARARAVKTPWERNKLRLAGARHHHCLYDLLPQRLAPGMTEREIAHAAWEVFFAHGHGGVLRMNAPGEECFLGHVCAGENGNYPSHFNGPLGVKGEHPASPFMGYAGSVWRASSPLALDIGFQLEGYHTDKTQLYWSGPATSIPAHVQHAHDLCTAVQNEAAAALKPGALPSQLYRQALHRVQAAGMEEGFMGIGANKVPFLGHGIGLAIDEYPALAQRFDEPLEEGMVIALEPKMGIAGLGMVGVENTYEVTPEGGRCLTGDHYDMVCIA